MQISLEIYLDDAQDALASVVCNAVPRVGEHIRLLMGETPESGCFIVQAVEHLLEPKRTVVLQHVCVFVKRCRHDILAGATP